MFFGKFPNSKRRKPLILLTFPNFSQKYFKNGSPKSVFGKMKNSFLGEFPIFGKHFWGICVFGWSENCNKRQEVCAYAKNGMLNLAYEKRMQLLHDYIRPAATVKNTAAKRKKKSIEKTVISSEEEYSIADLVQKSKAENLDIVEVFREHFTVEEIAL